MSSSKIIEYKITADSYLNIVQYNVNILLKDGWSLYGNLITANNLYIQAMVKYEAKIFPPLPINPPLPTGQPPHPLLDTRPFPLPPPLLPSANELKQKINVVTFSDAETKMMQTACFDLRMVLQGERSSSNYKDKKCVCISDMPTKLKNHLRTIGYEFSPVESFRNEDYCFMYLA